MPIILVLIESDKAVSSDHSTMSCSTCLFRAWRSGRVRAIYESSYLGFCDDHLQGLEVAKDPAIASFAWWSSGRINNERENSQHLPNTRRPCPSSTVSFNLPCGKQSSDRSTVSTVQHPHAPATFTTYPHWICVCAPELSHPQCMWGV